MAKRCCVTASLKLCVNMKLKEKILLNLVYDLKGKNKSLLSLIYVCDVCFYLPLGPSFIKTQFQLLFRHKSISISAVNCSFSVTLMESLCNKRMKDSEIDWSISINFTFYCA